MKIYLAGTIHRFCSKYTFKYKGNFHLESYIIVRSSSKLFDNNPTVKIMLDSGAFSAWNTGKNIDLYEYIRFIKDKKACLSHYISLDIIPGKPKRRPSKEEKEKAVIEGVANWKRMRKEGLEPIPVFHQGEEFDLLHEYIDGTDYVGISPQEDLSENSKFHWLCSVFEFLSKYPHVKTHGFGVTNVTLLRVFNWTSADSITWLKAAAFGEIIFPRQGNNYNVTPLRISVSTSEKADGSPYTKRYSSLSPFFKEKILDYVGKTGFKFEDLEVDSATRGDINVKYFEDLEHSLSHKHQKKIKKSFLL
ncbi:hypothetical protein KKF82_05680 [Patescibacteria group bacterium]|nr:hypothetical protein [Patescibacteria group bacterium]